MILSIVLYLYLDYVRQHVRVCTSQVPNWLNVQYSRSPTEKIASKKLVLLRTVRTVEQYSTCGSVLQQQLLLRKNPVTKMMSSWTAQRAPAPTNQNTKQQHPTKLYKYSTIQYSTLRPSIFPVRTYSVRCWLAITIVRTYVLYHGWFVRYRMRNNDITKIFLLRHELGIK